MKIHQDTPNINKLKFALSSLFLPFMLLNASPTIQEEEIKTNIMQNSVINKNPAEKIPIHIYKKNQWELTESIWNLGMASRSDVGIDPNPFHFFNSYSANPTKFIKDSIEQIEEGDTVWMRCWNVPEFHKEIFPKIKHPIVLIINDGDESFPSAIAHTCDIEELINSDKIIHIFAQNCDYKGTSNKVSHLPIGIDFHTIGYRFQNGCWGEKGSPKEQEANLKKILQDLKPTHLRKIGAFVDFHLTDTIRNGNCKRYLELGEDRTSIFNTIIKTGLIDYSKNTMARKDIWRIKGQYAFSISPHGNGLDCHRTWEDLLLGCIVIVKKSSLDPLYEGLPVVIVNDWSEITEENMKIWLDRYQDAFTNPSYRYRLTNAYWLNKIQSIIQPHKTKN